MSEPVRPQVLFVDDEAAVLSALRRALADEPFDVATCQDPREALRRIAADPPAVVVADFYMPGMHGPELLENVRGIDESVVRIVLTGKPDMGAVLDAIERGAVYRFLLKPWDEDELRVSLRTSIEYHELLRQRDSLRGELETLRARIARYESTVDEDGRRTDPKPPPLPRHGVRAAD